MALEVAIPPTYVLSLLSNEDAEPNFTSVVSVEENSQITIDCFRDNNIVGDEFTLKKGNRGIGMKDSKGRRITHYIHSYSAADDGIYICESEREPGVYHHRQIRLSSKRKVPRYLKPCEEANMNMCGSNGVCLLHNGQPTCYCNPSYEGTFCQTSAVDAIKEAGYSKGLPLREKSSTLSIHVFYIIILFVLVLYNWLSRKQDKELTKKKISVPMKSVAVTSMDNSSAALPESITSKFYNRPADMTRTPNPEAPGREIRRDDLNRKNIFLKKKVGSDEKLNEQLPFMENSVS